MGYGSRAREEPIAYLNGKLLPFSEAKISIDDRGFLYGDGLFETMRAYGGRVFQLAAHWRRLVAGAEVILLDLPFSAEELETAVYETLEANTLTEAVIRLSVSRGVSERGIKFPAVTKPTVAMVVREFHPYPAEFYLDGISIITLSDTRSDLSAIKSLNFLPNILAKREAEKQDAFEAVFVDAQGFVTEGTVSNIFLVRDGELLTPPPDLRVLPGVTREVVMELARKENIVCREEQFTKLNMLGADEIFLTNTTVEIMPAAMVDGKRIGQGKAGKITKVLSQRYKELLAFLTSGGCL